MLHTAGFEEAVLTPDLPLRAPVPGAYEQVLFVERRVGFRAIAALVGAPALLPFEGRLGDQACQREGVVQQPREAGGVALEARQLPQRLAGLDRGDRGRPRIGRRWVVC